jgi:Flp pilus assembly protein TadB
MLSRADRERVARIERNSERFRLLAENESDEHRKARYLRTSERLARVARVRRIYPLSVWLWGAAVVLVLIPWALLNRLGYSGVGVAASAALALVLVELRRRRRRRSGPEHDEE